MNPSTRRRAQAVKSAMHLGTLQVHSLGAISFKFANEAFELELHSERRDEESTNSGREALRKWPAFRRRRTLTSPSVRINILELEVPVTQLLRPTLNSVEC